MSTPLFYSTNKTSEKINIRDAILIGQAPDKGLYMPSFLPKLAIEEIDSFKDMKYHEIAYIITSKMLNDFIPANVLKRLCKDAYDFEVPIGNVTGNKYILRLDRGPTASFKDFAARFMARVMNYFLENLEKNLLILVATSGDTGGAVADAFYGQENVRVVILYPVKEVSERQRKQMTTLGGNIKAIGVDGKFDACQKIIKLAFADPDLKKLNLSSANSINFARLLPQTVYYFYAHSRICGSSDKPVIFSVPSGNFGDLMGGLFAAKMGLPVVKFIAAVNENDEFPKFLKSGNYEKIEPSKNCLSNAMNVGHPSNLARLVDLYGGQMDENGVLVNDPDMGELRKDIASVSISDDQTKKSIIEAYKHHKVLLEPHGAVAWAGLEWYLENQYEKDFKKNKFAYSWSKKHSMSADPRNIPCISLETADPAKFPEIITELLGIIPKISDNLASSQSKAELDKEQIPKDFKVFKKHLLLTA
jgi:threonine synthase